MTRPPGSEKPAHLRLLKQAAKEPVTTDLSAMPMGWLEMTEAIKASVFDGQSGDEIVKRVLPAGF